MLDQYLMSFYWVFNILMTHGMVHILPGTYAECIFSMLLLIIHLTLLSYIIGQVSNNVMTMEEELTKKREDNEQVITFVKSRALPESLAKDIKRFYYSHRAGMQIDLDLLYDHMSLYLRVRVAKHMGRELLGSVQMVAGCSANFLDMLAVLLRQVTLPENQVIFTQSELTEDLFILVKCASQFTAQLSRCAKLLLQRQRAVSKPLGMWIRAGVGTLIHWWREGSQWQGADHDRRGGSREE